MSKAKPITTGEEAPVVQAPHKFPLETLAAHCRKLFGVSSCTFAGATHGLSGSYTVAEMKSIIEKWKRQEVN